MIDKEYGGVVKLKCLNLVLLVRSRSHNQKISVSQGKAVQLEEVTGNSSCQAPNTLSVPSMYRYPASLRVRTHVGLDRFHRLEKGFFGGPWSTLGAKSAACSVLSHSGLSGPIWRDGLVITHHYLIFDAGLSSWSSTNPAKNYRNRTLIFLYVW